MEWIPRAGSERQRETLDGREKHQWGGSRWEAGDRKTLTMRKEGEREKQRCDAGGGVEGTSGGQGAPADVGEAGEVALEDPLAVTAAPLPFFLADFEDAAPAPGISRSLPPVRRFCAPSASERGSGDRTAEEKSPAAEVEGAARGDEVQVGWESALVAGPRRSCRSAGSSGYCAGVCAIAT